MIKEYKLPEGQDFLAFAETKYTIMKIAAHVEDISFTLCTAGAAIIEIDMQTYEMRKNSEMILMPGTLVRFMSVSPDFECKEFVVSQKFVFNMGMKTDPDFFKFLKFNPIENLSDEACETVTNHIYALAYDVCSRPKSKYAAPKMRNIVQFHLMNIHEMTYSQWRNERSENQTTHRTDLFRRYIQLVHDNALEHHDVDWYADQMAITPRYLNQICKGKHASPKALIDETIIYAAKEMIHSTEMTMQEIAMRLNFPDQSIFTRFFRRKTGDTPTVWRNKTR